MSKTLRTLAVLAVAGLIAATAAATEMAPATSHEPTPTPPRIRQSQGQGQSQVQDASAAANAGASVYSSPMGYGQATNSGQTTNLRSGDSQYYVMPAPVSAAPLPAGMCQKSSSRAFAIGWNFLSIGRSDSETEIDCLERALRAMPAPRVPMQLSDARLAHPITDDQVVALQPEQQLAAPPSKPRKKRPSTVAGKTVTVPKCGPSETLACVVGWR